MNKLVKHIYPNTVMKAKKRHKINGANEFKTLINLLKPEKIKVSIDEEKLSKISQRNANDLVEENNQKGIINF